MNHVEHLFCNLLSSIFTAFYIVLVIFFGGGLYSGLVKE